MPKTVNKNDNLKKNFNKTNPNNSTTKKFIGKPSTKITKNIKSKKTFVKKNQDKKFSNPKKEVFNFTTNKDKENKENNNKTHLKRPSKVLENSNEQNHVNDKDQHLKTKTEKRKEQKERLKFRKLNKNNGELIENAKNLWQKIGNSKNEAEKLKTIQQLVELVKGNIFEIATRHDASRVIQACIKYGDKTVRETIIDESKGKIVELTKNHYGRFLVLKLLKYANSEQLPAILSKFKGKVLELFKHREAGPIIDEVICSYSNNKEKNIFIQELFGPEYAFFKTDEKVRLDILIKKKPEDAPKILAFVQKFLNSITAKSNLKLKTVHIVMNQYLNAAQPIDRSQMIHDLVPFVSDFLASNIGLETAINCFIYATPKDRKIMLKETKGVVHKLCIQESNNSFKVILAILAHVDDTALLQKTVLTEIFTETSTLVKSTGGRIILLYIASAHQVEKVVDLKKYIAPDILNVLLPIPITLENGQTVYTNKKPHKTRAKEIMGYCASNLINLCIEHAEVLLFNIHGIRLFYEVVIGTPGQKQPILDKIVTLVSQQLDDQSEETKLKHVMIDPCAHRLLKWLIKDSGNQIDASYAKKFLLLLI
eukprot:TRINITY_DN2801_c0_g2_i1.p1 TRINITY_DN2801_c0_g2~~TRINITY_DN2801_c0_g2_i1.p1  ORF type:complete len:595 (-),score=225.15 TRINITY_DN2801_c0_g2_i1:415-2199(-)